MTGSGSAGMTRSRWPPAGASRTWPACCGRDPSTTRPPGPWQATGEAIAAGTAAQAALPPDTYPLERLQVIVPAVAATDRLRLHLDRPAVIAAARGLIAAMVDCLPAAGRTPPWPTTAPGRRRQHRRPGWRTKLCLRPPAGGLIAALRAALVLLADHELAASTLAARVAASVRADPYAVVGTGLGAMSGALHGGAALGAEVLLRVGQRPGRRAARGRRAAPPRGADTRVRPFRVPDRRPAGRSASRPDQEGGPGLRPAGRRRGGAGRGRAPGAARAEHRVRARGAGHRGRDGSRGGEAVFAVARTAGWLAHALEEYARATPIRPRGVYTGRLRRARSRVCPPGIRRGRGAFSLAERRSWRPAMAVRRLNHAVLYVSDLAQGR